MGEEALLRYVVVVVMLGLAAAATLLPGADPPEPGQTPASEVPPVAICPIVEAGDRHTNIALLSSVDGGGRLSTFAAGEETGELEFTTGEGGAVTLPAADADAVGVLGGLVEMPSETTAASSLTSGPQALTAEACADIPTGQAFIAEGSTVSDSFFEIQLINPYAGEATVDLTVSTDAGLESSNRFDGVVVPALSTINLDLTQIIPGRESISVEIETTQGSVLAYGRQTTDGRTALWRAVAPGEDWWLPVPPGGGTKQMRISTPENAEIEYQVDLYGPEGFVEGHDTGVIEARGTVRVPLAAVTSDASAVRVITTGPVVPTLWIDSPLGLARTTASQVDANEWLLPGAGAPVGGSGSITILNSGIEPVTVTVTSLSRETASQDMEVGAEGVLVVDLASADGYRIEATGPVVALWTSTSNNAGSAALGIPILNE